MSDREAVKRRIDELSPMGVRFVARMVDAMANPPQPQLASRPTWITADAKVSAFKTDGPTIDCVYGGHDVAARVSLDRSDAKITVKQILLAACDVHAEWELS
ncbi:MAG: hypothetical protein OXB92_01800 [Acidimicrobiaceae bacterium]|nr:hypothetical protein [Acidimicrobiia bacterium]MCY4492575.1 hypothetical protein [Acidimicrobiaceae bacterium]